MCPLDRVLTYKNLIYSLNLQFYCANELINITNKITSKPGSTPRSCQETLKAIVGQQRPVKQPKPTYPPPF